jgi:hypothetical protein
VLLKVEAIANSHKMNTAGRRSKGTATSVMFAPQKVMSALPPKAGIRRGRELVRQERNDDEVPKDRVWAPIR